MSTYCIASDYLLFDFLLLFSIQRQRVVEIRPAELDYLTYSIPNTLLLDTMCVYKYDDRTRINVLYQAGSRFDASGLATNLQTCHGLEWREAFQIGIIPVGMYNRT